MKIARKINEAFSETLDAAFKKKWGIELDTSFNIMSMALVSTRVDGKDLTKEQHAWVEAYSEGYGDAMDIAS